MHTIGKLSKTLGISVQSIRMYQKKGLIEPTYIDPETGYRYFADDDFGKLWRIKILQSAGFTLKEIIEIREKTISEIEDIITIKRDELEQTIMEKQVSLDYLNRKIEAIKSYQMPLEIEVKELPDRYGQDFKFDSKASAADYFNDLANIKGKFGMNQEVTHQPSRRTILKDDTVVLKDLFAVHEKYEEGLALQAGGKYICLRIKDRIKTKEAYNLIRMHAKENGYILRGDAIELLLLNNNLVDREDINLKEIQVAIKG